MKLKIFLIIALLLMMLSNPGCTSYNEKNPGVYIAHFQIGSGERYITENKCSLECKVMISNFNDVSATIQEWSFKIFENEEEVFEINSNNYDNFIFKFSIGNISAWSGKYAGSMGGWVFIFSHYWTNNVGDVYLYEEGDIFNSAHPNRIDFNCTIRDSRGFEHQLFDSSYFSFEEYD